MVNPLEQLYEITVQTSESLDEASYEELADFVDRREQIIAKAKKATYSQEEIVKYRSIVQELFKLDEPIKARMRQLMEEARTDVQKTAATKKFQNAYESAYQPDSYFFDRRK